jgi:hypothetical protein
VHNVEYLLTYLPTLQGAFQQRGTIHNHQLTTTRGSAARRRAANPAWDDEAAIGHCVRSFRNDVAVWWEEAISSDNSPKMLRALTKNWEEFEVVFR